MNPYGEGGYAAGSSYRADNLHGVEDSQYLQELWRILVEPWIRLFQGSYRLALFHSCVALCIGMTIVGLNAIYHLVPVSVRLVMVPAFLCGAYLVAERMVVPYIISRLRL